MVISQVPLSLFQKLTDSMEPVEPVLTTALSILTEADSLFEGRSKLILVCLSIHLYQKNITGTGHLNNNGKKSLLHTCLKK